MLNFNGKPLEELDYEECVEFEKQLLKKLLAADRAGMSLGLINQLQSFVDTVRMYKKDATAKQNIGLNGKQEDQADVLDIGEIYLDENKPT